MKRIDKVYQYVKENPKITAQIVANSLNITRSNASSDLNELVKQNILIKEKGKPVLFSCNDKNSLLLFSENNPSLNSMIEQAQAAVLYPPQRLHILLTGKTGVGKSMFANIIHQYSIESNKVTNNKNLLTFNCADYANNPQLILSQLFGVTKGSYTDSHEDRPGLVELADGGTLFLDEVHRLPPEAQEMLFTFIDQKVYRRLGETEFERHADVQLICATTENINSNLLETFIRRIPMKIHLPTLEERGLNERFNLITSFFDEESKNLKKNIQITPNTLRALLGYTCSNNIGQLKTDIQILCAQSYARSISTKDADITITSFYLPQNIKEGLYNSEHRTEIWTDLTFKHQ